MRALAAATLVTCLFLPGRATAYVQYRTSRDAGWSWQGTSCLPIVAYPRDLADLSAAEVGAAANAAVAAWNAGQNPCTYLNLTIELSTEPGPFEAPGPRPYLVFREQQWCHLEANGACGTAPEDVAAYQDNVLVLTTSKVLNRTGRMLRSSIEVNGVDFSWVDLALHPERRGATTQDLQNALTHELGHFIGLDHNCTPAGAASALDDRGLPAPDCDQAPADVAEATMFPTAPIGDLAKRTLSDDDARAVCDIYPAAQNPGTCVPPDDEPTAAGCACAAAPGTASVPFSIVALLGLALRRRRPLVPRAP